MIPNRGQNPYKQRTLKEQVLDNQAVSFLEVLALCQETQTLPISGGLLDQDSLFVHLMKYAITWQRERQEADNRRNTNKYR